MDAVLGQWRATYTPGDWVLLSGPTSLVLMEPPAPERSGMVTVLWEDVVASASMTDLASRLASYAFDTLPSFAAFFWAGDGMRSLVRGPVSVVDLETGATVARGEGIQTWTEVGLDSVRQVLVEVDVDPEARLELPLVVGAARASSVRLDATEAARVSSPQAYAAEAPPAYALLAPPAYAAEEPQDGPRAENDPTVPADELPEAAPAPELLPGPSTEPLEDPFADEDGWAAHEEVPGAEGGPGPEPWAEEPWEADAIPARALSPDSVEEMENASTQLMVPPPQASPTELDPESQHSMIMAVVCQYGHASAQNATSCRICGSPIAPQGPQLLPRPVLAVLRSSNGSATEVDRAVLIGRAPSGQRSNARIPKLMTVPSPGHDISRTHLEVAPEGWSVVVTDLHSTNGTILVRPDAERSPLPAGESVPVQLGSVVELGDGISVLIDFPQ